MEMVLDSGRKIFYVAPLWCNAIENESGLGLPGKNGNEESDKWEGVGDLCRHLDNAIEVEHDSKLFKGKRVLELGFCTGLPSAFAIANGASSVTIHCPDQSTLDFYVKPTLTRSRVPRSRCKFILGNFENFKRSLSAQKFDIILAPELTNTDKEEFEAVHSVLDAALSDDGIIILSSRTYYPECTGCLQTFLELLKLKGTFDSHLRAVIDPSEVAPRKIIQINRTIR